VNLAGAAAVITHGFADKRLLDDFLNVLLDTFFGRGALVRALVRRNLGSYGTRTNQGAHALRRVDTKAMTLLVLKYPCS
jgi:hypothetical protein